MSLPAILAVVGVIYSIALHEVGHAGMAFLCGDRTAKDEGRITLNPIPSISIVGSILVPAAAAYYTGLIFGWAKPVPVVPANYRSRVVGDVLVSMAVLDGILIPALNIIPYLLISRYTLTRIRLKDVQSALHQRS